MRWAAVTALGAILLPTALPVPAYAAPRAQCQQAPEAGAPKSQLTGEPWAQQSLSIKQAQSKATGRGVIVAVIDSGVEPRNPQLKGQVIKHVDLTKTGVRDCVGHGTAVTGIIAAKPGDSPFYGVAPDAKIISFKFAVGPTNNDNRLVAKAIDQAVKLGADVINISSQTPTDLPEMRAAVQRALHRQVVIVAAAGNQEREGDGIVVPVYPAQYDGVIAVGAIEQSGQVTQFSNDKTRISVIAPGNQIITTAPDGGYYSKDGTSFAAPFVAGVAALVKQRYPRLTAEQVKHRIEATANGSSGLGTGHGIVNPHEAVTAVLTPGNSRPAAAANTPVRIVLPERPDPFTRAMALGITGGALGAAALVAAAASIIPRGRRRGWRPGRTTAHSE